MSPHTCSSKICVFQKNRLGKWFKIRGKLKTADRPTYRDRGVDPLYVGLLHEDLPGLGAQRLHLRLLDGLAPPEQLDLAVEVAVVHRVRPSRSLSIGEHDAGDDGGEVGGGEAGAEGSAGGSLRC